MIREGYKEIKVSFGEDEEVVDNPAPVEMESEEEVVDPEDAAPAPVEKPKVQKESRAKKRIQQVLSQRDAVAAERDAALRELEELRRQMHSGTESKNASLKESLMATITTINRQMAEAIKAGEAEAVVALQDQLFNAKLKLSQLEQEMTSSKAPVSESPRAKAQEPAPVQIPEAAQAWLEDHPEFHTNQKFQKASLLANNQLLREGYDPQEDEFYEELDSRLSARFPDLFGIEPENSVQLKEDTSEGDSHDVKPAAPKVRAQTVAGSSRPSANTIRSKKSSGNDVTLTPQEVAQADAWGLPLERIASRIKYSEKNRREDGYVPIIIPRK